MSPKRLGKFELPRKFSKNLAEASLTYAKYVAEPFERGYGYTIGNAIRRVLLSSIEGAAITHVKIQGVHHEFQSIEGVKEDVTDIILNLKKVLLFSNKREPVRLVIDVEKEGRITAGDISGDPSIKIINPEQLICTLDRKKPFYAEFEVRSGRGYCSAESNKREEQIIGEIPIDALFSPVNLVKYSVENTRVGQITDYDKLILEVHTDGRIHPDEALKEAIAILKHHLSIFDQVSDQEYEFEAKQKASNDQNNKLRALLNLSVNEIDFSVRAANCLNNAKILTIGQLVQKTEAELLKNRNFGKKSLKEIIDKLKELGLSLNMNVSQFLEGDVTSSDDVFLEKETDTSKEDAVFSEKPSSKPAVKAKSSRLLSSDLSSPNDIHTDKASPAA